MKTLPFLTILLFSLHSFGQDILKSRSNNNHRRIQLGANFLSEYSNRSLKNNTGNTYHDYIIQERNGDEFGKFAFSTGLNACIGLTKFLSVETGINYANRGYRTKPRIDGGFHVMGDPYPYLETTSFIYRYRYLDIPLKLNARYGHEKIRFIGSLGLSANIFLNEKKEMIEVFDDESIKITNTVTRDKSMTKVGFTPMIAAGFDCELSKKMSIRIQSTYRKSITTLSEAPVHTYFYGVGVNAGYYYSLK